MPNDITALINEFSADSAAEDFSKSIRERLQQIIELYKVSRYRPTPNGSLMIDMDALVRGGRPRPDSYSAGGNGKGGSGKKGGAAGGAYSAYLKEDGAPGEQVNPDPFPEVTWVTIKDGSRVPPDLDDRAAKYIDDMNRLIINADFRVFTDMIDYWNRILGGGSAVQDAVTKAVRHWFQQALEETIIGMQALRKSRAWNETDFASATSEEALTAAVMPRYHVYSSVKRELGSKFGKLQAA